MTPRTKYRPKEDVLRAFYVANISRDVLVHRAVRQFLGNGYHHIDLDLAAKHTELLLTLAGIADWLIQPAEGEASNVDQW